MPFEALTSLEGDHARHIEQLWDEIKKLKEEVKRLNGMDINRKSIPLY